MKKIGIVGGVGWPSTIEYYRAICKLSQDHFSESAISGPSPIPEMHIESLNINYSVRCRGVPGQNATWMKFDEYFRGALKRLEDSGVDFAIIASNTPHNRFDSIIEGIQIPVISIFEAVAKSCRTHGIKDLLILGTGPTMSSQVFPECLKKHGIDAFVPAKDEDKAVIIELIGELYKGACEGGHHTIYQIVRSSYGDTGDGQKAVCLACTELPLAFKGKEDVATFEEKDVFCINTSIIHAKAAFDYAVAE